MIQFKSLLSSLQTQGVSFVIIGGVAATLHGAARVTFDLDIVYDRSIENLGRFVRALAPFQPYLRGAPPGLPFLFDSETLRRGLNFTLTTTEGPIDLLGELTGVGSFSDVLANSVTAQLFGAEYRFLDLEALIASKRAAGRPKDLEAIAELEAIKQERDG
jgi:predicted nucleotidyltransferase